MAKVTHWYRYATGEQVGTTVEGATSYPDALAELVHQARAAFADAIAIIAESDNAAGDNEPGE